MSYSTTKAIPQHVAIIMDGNRRWARVHGLPILAGHKKVADEVLEPLVERASQIGIKYLTVWAFSTENWSRSVQEVSGIMQLFRHSLKIFGQKMHKKGIRIQMIGDITRFDKDIRQQVEDLMFLTRENTRITVVFALNYGGRDEIMRAVNKYIYSSSDMSVRSREETNGSSRQSSNNNEFTSENFSNYLDTAGIPDPELIIRTGGEQRLSGFLLWQCQYSELYFPSWYMPDFTPERLDEAVEEYNSRRRRFGR